MQRRPKLMVSGLPRDDHAWNLMALQVILERMGCEVVNLGIGVPLERLVSAARWERPDCLVLSTMNRRSTSDALRALHRIRADSALAGLAVVIGGRITPRLEHSGFDAVFPTGTGRERHAVAALRHYLHSQFTTTVGAPNDAFGTLNDAVG